MISRIDSRDACVKSIHVCRLEDSAAIGTSWVRFPWPQGSLGQCFRVETWAQLVPRVNHFHAGLCTVYVCRCLFSGLRLCLQELHGSANLSPFFFMFGPPWVCRFLIWTLGCPVLFELHCQSFPAMGYYCTCPAGCLLDTATCPGMHCLSPIGVSFGLGPSALAVTSVCWGFFEVQVPNTHIGGSGVRTGPLLLLLQHSGRWPCSLLGLGHLVGSVVQDALRNDGVHVPNTHIGGSGVRTESPHSFIPCCGRWPPDLLDFLWEVSVGWMAYFAPLFMAFLRSVWLCCACAIVPLLLRPLRLRILARCTRQDQVWSKMPLVLGSIGSHRVCALSWQPLTNGLRRRRKVGGKRPHMGVRAMLLALYYLGILTLPHCVWSAPPQDWHDAVHKVEEMVNANHPPSQVPDELSSSTVCPPPMCQACPWTPITGDEGPEFTKCHFRVMSPRYQDEYVYLDMRIPGVTSDEAIREVQDCLVSLRLSFAKSLVPTTPQMNAGYATLILRGSWHSQYGDVIVVFDFRKLGGPSYAKRCCLVGTFYEIRQEALKHGFGHWDVYLFGGNEPLQPGARFRMVHGGVIQYCPAGYRPTWHGTFDSKFFAKRYWQESPLLLAVKPRAILLLGIGTTAFHDPADPDAPSLAQAAGLMVSRDEWHITLTPPSPGTQLDALWRGHICAGVLAVENHAPPASSVDERLCIFIDARQVGQRLVCTWVGHPDVPIDYLARFANVHRLPVGYHLSIARATPSALVNHIRVSNGDVVVLGFRSEDDSDFGSDPQESDRDDPDEDPDASTTKPDSASESDSPAPESTQGNGSSADSGRSRSPHRQGRLHGVCCFLGSCSVLSRAALRVLKQTLACSFRRMCMWTGCDRLQDAFPDGLAQLTPASLSDRKTMTFEPLCMKASPPPTLPQRLAAPAGEWRDLPGTGNAHHNEEELATIDAFLEPVQVDEDPDSSDEESDGSGRMATFLVLVPDCIPEQVEVWIDQALDERDVVDLVNDERNHQRYLLFSCLRPVWPQPARHWGALLAFPPWAETEHIACFDTRSLDGRLFAIGVPQVATREQFCSLAGGLDPFVISVFPYGSDRPLGPNELANFVAGGLVVLSPGSSFSPGQVFRFRKCWLSLLVGRKIRTCLQDHGVSTIVVCRKVDTGPLHTIAPLIRILTRHVPVLFSFTPTLSFWKPLPLRSQMSL